MDSMHGILWSCLFSIVAICLTRLNEPLRIRRNPWRPYPHGSCTSENYMCKNEKCIKRSWLCDGTNDCGDNSDEKYCNQRSSDKCPKYYPFFMCGGKCIPTLWKCDGISDCPQKYDELKCRSKVQGISGVTNAALKAQQWFHKQSKRHLTIDKWGDNVPRIAVALFLARWQDFAVNNTIGEEIRYEITLHLLHGMLKENIHKEPLSSNELAVWVNALLVTCMNPRDFYGLNLVARLRGQVDQNIGLVNPFLLLSLCNAGDTMTKKDVDRLFAIFTTPFHGLWTDLRALALIALSCVAGTENGPHLISQPNLSSLASQLKLKQHVNGRIEKLSTTGLVVQAMFASGEDETGGWDLARALEYLAKRQFTDGSFGSLLETYYILAALREKSLLDINAKHCAFRIQDKLENTEHVQVMYSLAHGYNISVSHAIMIRIDVNSSVFDVMRMASTLSSKCRFKHFIENSKPFIYELDGVQNDPEYGKFWLLHKVNKKTNMVEFINASPVDVIIDDKFEYMMWYRTF